MTVKRTRTSNEPELERPAAAKSPPNQAAAQLPSRTVPPPPVQKSADATNLLKLGGFLERCQYCKKRIPVGVEVFMYK